MNILVIGSGGREHALCWKLKQSQQCAALYCAPGNAGIAQDAECVTLEDHAATIAFAKEQSIDLVVVGPEQPLVDGLADVLREAGIAVFGPSAVAAEIEGSKGFSKDLCKQYNIPTAAYQRFTNAEAAHAYLQNQSAPIVIKADGLAAGKGVTIAQTIEEANAAVDACFEGAFGEAGHEVVIEAFLQGEEASFFALSDGEHVIEFASAQDHKAVGEGDTGPNTGGMGTYSPAPCMTDAMRAQVMEEIVRPTIAAMADMGRPYQGVLFVGLMLTDKGPEVIEYNCRFGDPETQVMLPRVEGDLAEILLACADGRLDEVDVSLSDTSAMCVVMAAEGYPGAYEKGTVIEGVGDAEALEGVTVFHAGTRRGRNCGKLKANGGRVLGVTAVSSDIKSARDQAYKAVDTIDWPEGFCRRDIGWRALPRSGS